MKARLIFRQDVPADFAFGIGPYTRWTEARHGHRHTVRTEFVGNMAEEDCHRVGLEAASDLEDWWTDPDGYEGYMARRTKENA